MATIIQRSFTDFDELAASARGWSMELSKLDRTAFTGDVFQWLTDGFIISRGRFGNKLKQGGCPPPGLRTVAVPLVRDMSMLWRGRLVTGDDLLVFPFGGELDAVSDSRFDVCTISCDEDALLAQAERMGLRRLAENLRSDEVFRCDPHRMDRLRRVLLRAARDTRAAAVDPVALKQRIQGDLIRLLGGAAAAGPGPVRSEQRLRIVRNAARHLAANPGEAVTVRDLCRAVGVSIRTLQYAFREHLGVSPKTYINSLRLNTAHQELRSARPGATCVADVANGLGFWHMGQFAADYRRYFGENPSRTLCRRT